MVVLDVVGVLLSAIGCGQVFESREELESHFTMLNIRQVQYLVSSYQPDENGSEPIPTEILSAVHALYSQLSEDEREQLPLTFPLHLSLTPFVPPASLSDSDDDEPDAELLPEQESSPREENVSLQDEQEEIPLPPMQVVPKLQGHTLRHMSRAKGPGGRQRPSRRTRNVPHSNS